MLLGWSGGETNDHHLNQGNARAAVRSIDTSESWSLSLKMVTMVVVTMRDDGGRWRMNEDDCGGKTGGK